MISEPDVNTYKTGKVITQKDDLNVRKEPSIESEKIGTVAKDSTINIISEVNGWYEIDFNGGSGYVSAEFIKVNDNSINTVENGTVSSVNMKGQINCQGEIVSGYTTDYICNGGNIETVRQSLGDNWHITAKNKCYNNGYWYELWDSDDGDYYGWVNEKYINFNNEIQSSNEVMISSVDNAKGQINCHGGIVAGYTTSYVCENGKASAVRKSLGDKWHITAKNSCYSHGVLWYELWDTDDGDYYGWVDSNYIDFY